MPNHTFTYRPKELVAPLNELIAWLRSQLAACRFDLDKIADDVDREKAKANEPRPSTLSELARAASIAPERKAALEQRRLQSLEQAIERDHGRATLWRDECLRSSMFKKFTLDESELEWLYRWKAAALSAG